MGAFIFLLVLLVICALMYEFSDSETPEQRNMRLDGERARRETRSNMSPAKRLYGDDNWSR